MTMRCHASESGACLAMTHGWPSCPPNECDGVAENPVRHDTHLYRGVIAVEGAPTIDGRRVRFGVLTWRTLPVPVYRVAGRDRPADVVGHLIRIDRIDDYLVGTAQVTDDRPLLPCGIDLTGVRLDDDDWINESGRLTIAGGEIIALTIYVAAHERPAWPGCALLRVEEVTK